MLVPDESISVFIDLFVKTEGDYKNVAEVLSVDQQDIDSTPNNGSEDDYATLTPDVQELVDLVLTSSVSNARPGVNEVGHTDPLLALIRHGIVMMHRGHDVAGPRQGLHQEHALLRPTPESVREENQRVATLPDGCVERRHPINEIVSRVASEFGFLRLENFIGIYRVP